MSADSGKVVEENHCEDLELRECSPCGVHRKWLRPEPSCNQHCFVECEASAPPPLLSLSSCGMP